MEIAEQDIKYFNFSIPETAPLMLSLFAASFTSVSSASTTGTSLVGLGWIGFFLPDIRPDYPACLAGYAANNPALPDIRPNPNH